MTCKGPQSLPSAGLTMDNSVKLSWNEQKDLVRQKRRKVTCGMLPTLRVLASQGCNSQGSACLVPFDMEMDAARHLQMTLLEAYCREVGVKVLRVSRETLRDYLCPENVDLSCVLVTNGDPYYLESPE